ncbi:MAG: hypothetical protein ACOX6S_07045 [Clostridia bacterium]|jgi:hypothetical protein
MDNNPMPTLLLRSSGIPGLIKMNDILVGEITQDIRQRIPIPVSATGACFISFIPLVGCEDRGNYLPVTRKFIFHQGRLVIPDPMDFWDNIALLEWPGNIYEVTVSPLYIPYPPLCTSIPETIDQAAGDFNGDDREEIATVFIDNCLHVVIEDPTSDRLLFHYTPLFGKDSAHLYLKDMTGKGLSDLVLRGPVDDQAEFITVISWIDGEYRVLLDVYGNSIDISDDFPGKVRVLQRLEDTCRHDVSNTYTFDGKVFGLSKADILWLSGEPSWPKSPQNTVKAFLDAVKLNLEQEAMGFLSHSCRNRMPYREIKGLLGEFEGWHELDFPHPAYSTPHIGLGLLYPIHQKYRKLEAFFFETVEEPNHQGLYKINRIGKISSPVV